MHTLQKKIFIQLIIFLSHFPSASNSIREQDNVRILRA